VRPAGAKRKLLMMCDAPANYAKFLESIQAIKRVELEASSAQVSYQQLSELEKSCSEKIPMSF